MACSVDGCEKPVHHRGLCGMHDQRLRRTGETGEAAQRHALPGEGRIVNLAGYIVVTRTGHPLADPFGHVYEHRLVAWEAGVLTDPTLIVHHRNGDRADNRLENLEVTSRAEHSTIHATKGCLISGCERKHYGRGQCQMHWQQARRAAL